jgi:hypothetical protein
MNNVKNNFVYIFLSTYFPLIVLQNMSLNRRLATRTEKITLSYIVVPLFHSAMLNLPVTWPVTVVHLLIPYNRIS